MILMGNLKELVYLLLKNKHVISVSFCLFCLGIPICLV